MSIGEKVLYRNISKFQSIRRSWFKTSNITLWGKVSTISLQRLIFSTISLAAIGMILYWNSWELIWTSSLRCKTKRNLSSNISTFEFLQWLIYPLEKSDGRKLQVSISGEANPDWRQANSDQNHYIWPIPDAKGPAIVKVYWFQLRDLGHRVDFSIHKPKRKKKERKRTNVLFQMEKVKSPNNLTDWRITEFQTSFFGFSKFIYDFIWMLFSCNKPKVSGIQITFKSDDLRRY